MQGRKNEAGNLLPMTVTEGVTVNVLPYEQHEFLMTSREVATGYGVTNYAIRKNKLSLGAELVEGKHFVLGVTIGNAQQPHQVYWTKRGVVRLGFAMRSERAKLFRDWAEELIIKVEELAGAVQVPAKQLPKKTKANRLTQERLLDIMGDVCRIDDKELRLRISTKLMGGQV